MKRITLLIIFAIALLSTNMNAQMKPTKEAVKNLEPYPIAIDSLERHVIYVEQKDNEALFEIELIPGKMLEVDCNNHSLMGQFEENTVEGWGYNYYIFETEGHVAATMMLCHQPKEMKFVSGATTTVRYNSRLPIVVYLPEGYDLRYKIWSAGEEQVAIKQ